jgi:hypothetical protein
MIGNALASIGHFFFGWPSVSILVGVAALVIATLEPPIIAAIIPDLRKWSIAVAVIAFSLTSIAGKYYDDGLTEKQRQWDAAVTRETANGEKARVDAVATIGPVPANRSVFKHDPFNRNRKH